MVYFDLAHQRAPAVAVPNVLSSVCNRLARARLYAYRVVRSNAGTTDGVDSVREREAHNVE